MARIGESRREAMVPRALRAAIGFGGLALAGVGTAAHLLALPYPEPMQVAAFAGGALLGLVLEFRSARHA
ncbi:hypothetical protein [Salinarimonas ramus]|uniref:Uncharacterized protein n=1 Tax=Salinarimonas ramus TaxID=690164 RepID=A0A917QC08_9HYPH|nr:hypothetical protein [Salinarimonas ramus]GGK42016.1 hypothetical protein GCM10011322_31410 [Salinarimonas ramus]